MPRKSVLKLYIWKSCSGWGLFDICYGVRGTLPVTLWTRPILFHVMMVGSSRLGVSPRFAIRQDSCLRAEDDNTLSRDSAEENRQLMYSIWFSLGLGKFWQMTRLETLGFPTIIPTSCHKSSQWSWGLSRYQSYSSPSSY